MLIQDPFTDLRGLVLCYQNRLIFLLFQLALLPSFSFFEINNKFVISKPRGEAIDVFTEIVLDGIEIFRGCENYLVICIGTCKSSRIRMSTPVQSVHQFNSLFTIIQYAIVIQFS